MSSALRPSLGRISVLGVGPAFEEGRWPAKAVVGEAVPMWATIFREGHDAVGATLVVTAPDGTTTTRSMPCEDFGMSLYRASTIPSVPGDYLFAVEAWSDPVTTWHTMADVKLHAGQDIQLVLAEGVAVLERAAEQPGRPPAEARVLYGAIAALRDNRLDPEARVAAAMGAKVRSLLERAPLREWVTRSAEYPLRVDRERALVSAWYEMFPRSEGARYDADTKSWVSGTFATAAKRLPAIARMGFDIVYLTPIHPIGTSFRKGRNNSLDAAPGDPGSPYAIGSPEGGHDAIHPDLGTMADFRAFVAKAGKSGLEVGLDLALQCSPDHPWVTRHPEWFGVRADGSIAYAENPPKKYQDIYPLNFDRDPEGLYQAIREVVEVWIGAGVTAFRVDNPHTKPLTFWERLLGDVRATHPDVIFLSEAFTLPAMMHTLAKIGFHQSYTYFAWRPSATEMGEYLTELAGASSYYMRPNFWPTTHDILTPDMQSGGAASFASRAVVAATGSPSWGIYSGYELVENVARPGVEEHIDNEKYEYKPRDWARARRLGIARLLTTLNETRRAHPALQRLRGLTVHPTDNPAILCFSRHVPADESPTGRADAVIVAVSFDAFHEQATTVTFDPAAIGLKGGRPFAVEDALTGQTYEWGEAFYVKLGPATTMAHVAAVRLA